MLVLCPLKGTTKGTDILEATKTSLARFHLSLKNLAGLATDGSAAMIETMSHYFIILLIVTEVRER
jgi:hypothetical protein